MERNVPLLRPVYYGCDFIPAPGPVILTGRGRGWGDRLAVDPGAISHIWCRFRATYHRPSGGARRGGGSRPPAAIAMRRSRGVSASADDHRPSRGGGQMILHPAD